MIDHSSIKSRSLLSLLRSGAVQFAGNKKLRIYGRLDCSSGKRMKKANRVFFQDQEEAIAAGFRPCGHCMRREYNSWKKT